MSLKKLTRLQKLQNNLDIVYLKGVEDGKEMGRKELSIGQENKHARIEKES